jgi:cell fate regulator YaaT (PSP1 superfamily)
MGCASCGPNGCSSQAKKTAAGAKVTGCQNNGTCGTSGCNKLNVFDWLGNMELPGGQRFNIMEVRFKGGRKEFYRNVQNLDITTGDAVVVEGTSGYHVGYVSLQGELVRLQMLKKKVKETEEFKSIYRLANERDLDKYHETQNRELPTLYRTREIAKELKMNMKLSDVEFQADNTKATFFYSADDRVDFRELIKTLAGEFKVRVEMRQITLRQEASRLGGIGVCGRELCCSTWLSDFKSVSTAAARYQNLSLNPSKLSGQCGRLKCCLNYELETYLDALTDIPKVDKPLLTAKGPAHLQKTDIFRKMMWFSYDTESTWYPLTAERVKEVQALNQQGVVVATLQPEADTVPKANTGSDPGTTTKPDSWVVDQLDESKFNRQKGGNQKRNKKKRRPEGSAKPPVADINPAAEGEPKSPRPEGEGRNQRNQRQNRDQNRDPNRRNGSPNRQNPPAKEGQDGQSKNPVDNQDSSTPGQENPSRERGGRNRNRRNNNGGNRNQPPQNRKDGAGPEAKNGPDGGGDGTANPPSQKNPDANRNRNRNNGNRNNRGRQGNNRNQPPPPKKEE